MLDAGAFEQLVRRLGPDREGAAAAYVLLHRKLVRFFSHRAAANPEELADETLDRVARRLAGGEDIADPVRYAHGVARRVWQETWKARPVETLGPDMEAADETPTKSEELLDACVDACLADLSQDNRNLVLGYYAVEGSARIARRAELAAQLGMSPNGLRIRVCRLKAALAVAVRDRLGNDGFVKRITERSHTEWEVSR